ncbi:MAG: Gfo/Idh/MocA family protein [Armatimonadota bacterium]
MEPLGAAILGLRHLHARGWAWNVHHVEEFRLVAVADPDASLREQVASDFDVRAMRDYESAMSLDEVSVVLVLVPHSEMPDVSLAAISAGKHLIVEKPCAANAAGFRPVAEALQDIGLAFTTPYLWRYDPVVLRARELICAGEIGQIAYLAGRINAGAPERYAELSPWMLERAKSGGGPLLNLGVHWVDALSWLVGSEPVAVTGQTGRLMAPHLDIEDHARVLLRFATGQQALVETSYAMPSSYPPTGYDSAMLLKGTEGYVEWTQRDDVFLVCTRDGEARAEALDRTAGGWTDAQGYGGANGLNFLADFAAAVGDGRAPPITARDALRALLVADAAYRSAAAGRTVEVSW